MVAVDGRELLHRVVGVLHDSYNRCLTRLFRGGHVTASPPSSIVDTNPKRPNEQIPKGRKQGRVKRKRYRELAKDNSTTLMPGGFRDGPLKREALHHCTSQDDHDLGGHDSETTDEVEAGPAYEGRRGRREAFVMKQVESLMFDKLKRESQFNAKAISERVKKQAPERQARMRKETMEAERLWKMEELERREEKERANRWRDRRLAQLEREKLVAENELAREKVERKQSRLRQLFEEQQRRHREEGRWKQLREREARLTAEREANLLRENAILEKRLGTTDNAFRRACNERDYMVQEKEEERSRRLRAEESLHRWKELMNGYSPEGQRQQHPDQREQQQQQSPSLGAQFELYEKKWKVLRSGIDIDGTEVHLIFFSQIPWPVINMTPTDPSQIQPEHIQEFLAHPLREKPNASGNGRDMKAKAKDELKRWHSDQFNRFVLPKVREEDKLAAVEAAEIIAKVLINILT